MLSGASRTATFELIATDCYKSFSLNFGGDGAGGTADAVLEFLADTLSSSS